MLKLKYINENTFYSVNFNNISNNIIQITGVFPIKTIGFNLYTSNKILLGNYNEYNTVYKELSNGAMFSNNGKVFIPTITFTTSGGGSLQGNLVQSVDDYSKLVVPIPQPDENYIFKGWNKKIPEIGKIEQDETFVAEFEYVAPLSEVQEAKVQEMNEAQQEIIAHGLTVKLSDGNTYPFSLTTNDQISIMGSTAVNGMVVKGTPWHIADESVHCQYYSEEDMNTITKAAYLHVTYHVTYFRDLRIYIRALTDKAQVEAIQYGVYIPEEYQSEVLKDLLAQLQAQPKEVTE